MEVGTGCRVPGNTLVAQPNVGGEQGSLATVPASIAYCAAATAARLADRHYVWMILLHRYPHGIRGVAGFAYGMSQLPWSTFLALNFVAAGLWSCAVVSAGYAFGQVSEKVMSDASSGLGLVMLLAFLGLSWVLSKKLERVAERN